MKHNTSAHCSDTIKLSIIDIFKLIIGKTIKGCGINIALWYTPSDGCDHLRGKK